MEGIPHAGNREVHGLDDANHSDRGVNGDPGSATQVRTKNRSRAIDCETPGWQRSARLTPRVDRRFRACAPSRWLLSRVPSNLAKRDRERRSCRMLEARLSLPRCCADNRALLPGTDGIMLESPDSPSLRFRYSEDLHARAVTLLDRVEHAADATEFRKPLGELVVELTDAGLNYYFLKPLELANGGFLSTQSAAFGISSAVRIMSPFIRSTIGGMDKKQLVVIAGYLRRLMG
jgi:hypothetical protein